MLSKLKTGLLATTAAALLAVMLSAPGNAAVSRGDMPPDFTGKALDGRKITLSEFRGKHPVVLNFFADFCPPCRKEFPHLKALDVKHRAAGLKVISVSLDEDRETAGMIPGQHRVAFPVIFDPTGGIAEKYGVQAIPHTVVIDRSGTVHAVLIGLDPEALTRAVEEVLR